MLMAKSYGKLADKLRKLRKSLNLKQGEMAEKIGVAKSTYQNWEYGHQEPSGPALRLLQVTFPGKF